MGIPFITVCPECDKNIYEVTLPGYCLCNRANKQLTAKDARIAELETWLSRSLGDYPCEHLPEDDVNNYPNCGYCRMQVEAMKALQSSPQTDKE